jgi:hypothetical protein
VFTQTLCARHNGFRPYAAVPCAADDWQTLEPMCRDITGRTLANGRVRPSAAGQVELQRETAWRDGTTHLATAPIQFMQRQLGGGSAEARFVSAMSAVGLTLPTADVGYPVAQLWGQLSGGEIARPTGAGRPVAVPRVSRLGSAKPPFDSLAGWSGCRCRSTR